MKVPPSHPTAAPGKRFRGKKRYFRRVALDAENFTFDAESLDYWDLWHYHADWPGWGNRKWRYRHEHLKALTVVYRNIAASASKLSVPFQSWIYLSGRDAGEDATYVHTPNPLTPFPVQLIDVRWGHTVLLPILEPLLPDFPLRIGHWRGFDQFAEPPRVVENYFVYSPAVGVALEPLASELG